MTEKKVLIITYYWPPSGGSGVQRWLKFVKYLPSFGYTPYVFTPENPSFDLKDPSLLKDVPSEAEVIHFPIWEPYNLFFHATRLAPKADVAPAGSRRNRESFLRRLGVWVRGNFLIPDPRVFWVKPSVEFLKDFIVDNKIKLMITTGPPHSMHLIGWRLKKNNPSLKWIADFRDPWSTWGLLDTLRTGKVARGIHRYLENKVLRGADRVITITPFYQKKFAALSNRKVDLFTNGFDDEDFVGFKVQKTEKFLVRHVGIINDKCDPRPLMSALKQLVTENPVLAGSLVVEFVGHVHPGFRAFVTDDEVLAGISRFTPPVPHQELMGFYSTSSLLLLVLTGYRDAEGYMPGKLFEYIATGIPVLGVGPTDGDAASLIRQSGAGLMVDSSDVNGMKDAVMSAFNQWSLSDHHKPGTSGDDFSRRAITGRLAEYLNNL